MLLIISLKFQFVKGLLEMKGVNISQIQNNLFKVLKLAAIQQARNGGVVAFMVPGYMVDKTYLDIATYLGAFGAYLMPQ